MKDRIFKYIPLALKYAKVVGFICLAIAIAVPFLYLGSVTMDNWNELQEFDYDEEDETKTEYTISFSGVSTDFNENIDRLYEENQLTDKEKSVLKETQTHKEYNFTKENTTFNTLSVEDISSFGVESDDKLYLYEVNTETIGDYPDLPHFNFVFYVMITILVGLVTIPFEMSVLVSMLESFE